MILITKSRDNALGITTGCGLDEKEVGVRVPVSSRPVLRPTQTPIQRVQGALSPGISSQDVNITN
jgi:hypothetical protein